VSSGDYPAEWEADVVLSDGGTVHVRPVRPSDAERLVAFHGRLSHQSVYYRFFSPRPRLSQDDVTRFTTVDYDDRMALVALLGDDLIGIASYDRWPGRREAEVAFTVDDEHQGRGVATVLLEHLAVIARSHGMTRFTAEVLPENRKMLSVFKRAGFQAKSRFADGVVEVEMGILETDEALEAMHEREHIAEARSVARLPRRGPSRSSAGGAVARGHEVLQGAISPGFTGAVGHVHPTAHDRDVRAWPSVLDVPATSMSRSSPCPRQGRESRRAMCPQRALNDPRCQASPKSAAAIAEGSGVDRPPSRHACLAGEHGRDQHGARGLDARDLCARDPHPRQGRVLQPVRPARRGAARAGPSGRRRHLAFRRAREQGGREHERLPPVLGGRRGDVGDGVAHRVVRQPTQVHETRTARLEDEADRGGEDRWR
jgi:RimJ/RimL family protein N-acetyltransferase